VQEEQLIQLQAEIEQIYAVKENEILDLRNEVRELHEEAKLTSQKQSATTNVSEDIIGRQENQIKSLHQEIAKLRASSGVFFTRASELTSFILQEETDRRCIGFAEYREWILIIERFPRIGYDAAVNAHIHRVRKQRWCSASVDTPPHTPKMDRIRELEGERDRLRVLRELQENRVHILETLQEESSRMHPPTPPHNGKPRKYVMLTSVKPK